MPRRNRRRHATTETATNYTIGLAPAIVKAATLVQALWRQVSPEYKSLYRKTIWDQLESTIRGTARRNAQLPRWWEDAKRRLSAAPPHRDDVATVAALLAGSDGARILDAMRSDTSTVVVLVRVWSEERRQAWQQSQQTEEPIDIAAS